MISINDPVLNSSIFIVLFSITAIFTIRRKKIKELFPTELTQELKGLAILLVVFSHIGYFLISDHRFLFPFSILAGVGVNLFLFLSGYGLTASAFNAEFSIFQFYTRRIKKIYIPLWLTILVFLLLDFFILKIDYSGTYIIQSLAGFFPGADLFKELNSPLWYITLTMFYFLIFPVVFSKKHPWVSAAIIYAITAFIVNSNQSALKDVMRLYEVHIMAFPLGMVLGGIFYKRELFLQFFGRTGNFFSGRYSKMKPSKAMVEKDSYRRTKIFFKYFKPAAYFLTIIASLIIISYTAIFSHVGQNALLEEMTSLVTMFAVIIVFSMKKIEIGLLHLFGLYSFEIYLLHWPILSRYEIFYQYFPAWLATILYLILFLLLGRGLKKLSKMIAVRSSFSRN